MCFVKIKNVKLFLFLFAELTEQFLFCFFHLQMKKLWICLAFFYLPFSPAYSTESSNGHENDSAETYSLVKVLRILKK